MATYFHGNSEIQADGLQTLYLMNPSYVGYSDTPQSPTQVNMGFLNSTGNPLNPANLSQSGHSQNEHYVGIPLQQDPSRPSSTHQEISALNGFIPRLHYNLWPSMNQQQMTSPSAAANNSIVGVTDYASQLGLRQGLSLSLSHQQPAYGNYGTESDVQTPTSAPVISQGRGKELRVSGGSSSSNRFPSPFGFRFPISDLPPPPQRRHSLETLTLEKIMAIKHIFDLARRSRKLSSLTNRSLRQPNRFASTSPAISESLPVSPPAPNVMIYDRIAEEVKSKIKRLENPDSRFLQHGSPHPVIIDHTKILSAPETRVTTLPNGLRVATESNLSSKTATVGVWIDAGSRFETDETNGTAHFLEHMIFKGTEKRSVRVLEEEIENMGGHLNAYTSREQTTYYAKVMDKDVPKALDILADILQNSCFNENRINRERDVILREMEEVEGQAEEVIFDHLHATAFQYSPLGRTILGPAQNIKTITKAHLQNYISTHYTAPRMVIAAAGAVKHEDIVEQVKKLFTKLSSDPTTATQLAAKEPAFFTGSEVRLRDDDVPLAQFAVAFSGASWTDPDSIALMVMQSMLGSWSKSSGGGKHMGSELAQRVGINEIAESMMAFNTNYKDTGLFGVYAIAKPDCLDDLAYAIMYELSKLSYRVSEADVTRARNQLKSSLLLHIDGTSPVAEDIGRQLLTYGRRIPFAELFARIDAVDASTIKRVANRFIFDRDVAIAAMGPIQSLPDYNWFRRRTYLLRY